MDICGVAKTQPNRTVQPTVKLFASQFDSSFGLRQTTKEANRLTERMQTELLKSVSNLDRTV